MSGEAREQNNLIMTFDSESRSCVSSTYHLLSSDSTYPFTLQSQCHVFECHDGIIMVTLNYSCVTRTTKNEHKTSTAPEVRRRSNTSDKKNNYNNNFFALKFFFHSQITKILQGNLNYPMSVVMYPSTLS